ncbi:MAG: S9 family peptidase [Candidatus Dadabacteria bacterium]|nr:MAG: S9 family peptidase [Candidatus Dadabacteria bacterium]
MLASLYAGSPASAAALNAALRAALLEYPEAPRDPGARSGPRGHEVPDPYRPLEDLDDPATKSFMVKQDAMARRYLQLSGEQEWQARVKKVFNVPKKSAPIERGDKQFHLENTGLQDHWMIMVADRDGSNERVLIDPNRLSDDGTVAVTTFAPSLDGRLVAYSVSEKGSDWQTIYVRDVESGKDLTDKLEHVKFSGISWDKDRAGFYYSRYPEPEESDKLKASNRFHRIYYHRVGTSQREDTLVYESTEQPTALNGAFVTEDGRYLVISSRVGSSKTNDILVKDLTDPNGEFKSLFTTQNAAYSYIGNDKDRFYFWTNQDAPRGRVIGVKLGDPSTVSTVIPESNDKILQSASMHGDHFIAHYLHNASSELIVYEKDGTLKVKVDLPGIISVDGVSGLRSDKTCYISCSSFVSPPAVYRYDPSTNELTEYYRREVPVDLSKFTVKQLWYKSRDGTEIPMFVVHRKDIELNGDNPTYLYGYGGFNTSLTPAFNAGLLPWLEAGGVYAQPALRGGGEFGREWHEAGMRENKQNVFDDFIAAAEWLIGNGYTKPKKLAIGGGSNGGLLVAACTMQRPELFGAVIASNGVYDMLRFHKLTDGKNWIPEYGDPDNPDDFEFIIKYSPLHNVKSGTEYPAMLIMTADHDDRVWPGHSLKLAAALQASQAGDLPILLRVERGAGHGLGTPLGKAVEGIAARWAFLRTILTDKSP